MTTLTNMIDEVSVNLMGYTIAQDRSTHLTTAMTATASTGAVPILARLGSTDNVGMGVIEIEEELLWVSSLDRLNNTATISPFGRGYLGTTADTHAVDTKVTISPVFPRVLIKKAINDTITALGAMLPAVGSTTIVMTNASAYRLPTTGVSLGATNILSITWQSYGVSKEWIPVKAYKLDQNANTTAFDSGQSISIYDGIPASRSVQITYAKDPLAFTTNSQTFTTQTGLPESCKDLVIYGAIYRLLSNLDPARAAMVSPQADETDSKRPYGSSQSATKMVLALYTQRLGEEIRKHQARNPIRPHYTI